MSADARVVQTAGVGKCTATHLNLALSLADVYDIRMVWTGNGNAWQWTERTRGQGDDGNHRSATAPRRPTG